MIGILCYISLAFISRVFYIFSVLEQLTEGVDCGDEAGEWVSKHLNKPGARIVRFSGIGNKRTLEDAGHILKVFDMNKPQENPKVSSTHNRFFHY